MKLRDTNLCVESDCEELFTGPFCPSCGSMAVLPLTRCVLPMEQRQPPLTMEHQINEGFKSLRKAVRG